MHESGRDERSAGKTSDQIIGIVEDFYCGHLSQPVLPIAFIYGETYLSQIPLQAKIAPGHQKDAVAFLENLHNDNADGAFNYTFAKQEVENLYTLSDAVRASVREKFGIDIHPEVCLIK